MNVLLRKMHHHANKYAPTQRVAMNAPVTVVTWWMILIPASVLVSQFNFSPSNLPLALSLSLSLSLLDFDECSSKLENCEQICTNTDGSFNCSCRSGFNSNGHLCTRETYYLPSHSTHPLYGTNCCGFGEFTDFTFSGASFEILSQNIFVVSNHFSLQLKRGVAMTTLDVALPSVPTSVALHTATAPRDSNWMTLKPAVLVCNQPLTDYINYLSLSRH